MNVHFITTDDMARYIISRMGGQVNEIEMVVEEHHGLGHVYMAINDTADYFYRYCFDEAAYVDYMLIRLQPGVIEYHVPDEVMNVVELMPSYGNTFSPMMAWDVGPGESLMGVGGAGMGGLGQFDLVTMAGAMRSLADTMKFCGTQYNIKLHPVDHILRVFPTPKTCRNAMACVYTKAKKSELYNNVIFRDMAVARAQIQLGDILKRDDYAIPGGGKINGSLIYTDAMTRWKDLFDLMKQEAPGPLMMTDLSGL